jgi:hypothetical protein
MTDDAIMKFILLVEVHFPRPKFQGDEKREAVWVRSMSEILGAYSPDVLSEAAAMIVRSRDPKQDGTMFPKPCECIAACERIMRLRELQNMALAIEEKEQRGLPAIQSALPLIVIARDEPAWDDWLEFLRRHDRGDLASDAERLGYIKASSRWPYDHTVIFEPYHDKQFAMRLAALPKPKSMEVN